MTELNSRDSKQEQRVVALERLLKEAEAGQFDNLLCPGCSQAEVSVWFTHPAEAVYRIWFICADCGFHTRAQCSDEPKFFSEHRVSTDLQERDLEILKQAFLKKPPTGSM